MSPRLFSISSLFFFSDTATTQIYTLSLHDALPIFIREFARELPTAKRILIDERDAGMARSLRQLAERSEERRVGKECRSRWLPDDKKKKRRTPASSRGKCSHYARIRVPPGAWHDTV